MAQSNIQKLDTMRKKERFHKVDQQKIHKALARQNTLKKKAKTSKSFKIKV